MQCKYKSNIASLNADSNQFMAHYEEVGNKVREWLIDCGCSNHLKRRKELLKILDETKREKVKLGDNKEMQMSGEDTVAMTTSEWQAKLLHKSYYVPSLAYNLLSDGQLLLSGYTVLFSNEACYIKYTETRQLVINDHMTTIKCFHLISHK